MKLSAITDLIHSGGSRLVAAGDVDCYSYSKCGKVWIRDVLRDNFNNIMSSASSKSLNSNVGDPQILAPWGRIPNQIF